jgi:hypothetical protein
LKVTGDRAVIGFRAGGTFDLGPAVVTLVDGGGHGADRFRTEPVGGSTPDCSQALSPLSPLDGHADVFDGQPLPTMKDQCKSGGWRQWDFKNQGRCVSFVNDR